MAVVANEAMQDASRASQPATGCVVLAGGAQTLTSIGRGIVITTTGNIAFTMQDGSTFTWNSIPVGMYGGLTVRAITVCTAAGMVLV